MKENQQNINGNEVERALEELRQIAAFLGESEDGSEMLQAVGAPLETMRQYAEQHDFGELARAVAGLERYLNEQIGESPQVDAVMAFSFALSTLLELLEGGELSETAAGFKAADVLAMLGAEDMEEPTVEKEPAVETEPETSSLNFSKLQSMISNLGGTLELSKNGNSEPVFHIVFPATEGHLRQVETVFSPLDSQAAFAAMFDNDDSRFAGLLNSIRDFMHALAEGDMNRCQEILSAIAEQQHQAGLYREIGTMARDLHNSLKGFMQTLDPTLREMVEDKIPDSGNRLEHILKLTDNAANTTLDNVEQMQMLNQKDQQHLDQLDELITELRAVGEPAQEKLNNAQGILQELKRSAAQIHDALITVTTAQDYQDLTGQIIMKIINLLNELERKLVEIIKTFGVKVGGAKEKTKKDELYGPAHEHMNDALSSQDDVDALLAEFGF